ncbi:MAG: glycosyltransferase family 2 protein [Candidatus Paceibacterota bacterium]
MKTSVVIISHNEEKYIKECIESILNQTEKASEIILIAHNCEDNTISIAKEYPEVNTIKYNGPKGIIYARIEGLSHVTGDIILCIDGDSVAYKNWVEEMVKILNLNNILVSSWTKFKGTLFGKVSNIFNKYLCKTKDLKATSWVWGTSFGFWSKDIEQVRSIFKESEFLMQKLNLSKICDDFWLALFMLKNGNIEVTNKTHVTQNQKEKNSMQAISRNFENHRNGSIIKKFFQKNY